MRKQLAFPTFKKNYHIRRRRYSHHILRSQPIQENFNIDIQDSQSTLSENIRGNDDDDMDFQYYDNEEIEESSKDNNEKSSEDEDERISKDEDEGSLEEFFEDIEDEESSDESFKYEESSEEFLEYEDEEYLDENEELSLDEEINDNENDEIENESSEDEEEFGNIIDKALDKNKMPSYSYNNDNEFAPYFENFTTASLFCWIQKHNISTSAYEDLAEIIHNSQFVSTHVVKNIRRFRKWRQHLPLLPILAKSISISSKKTPSTSKNSKLAYQLSINDIIWNVLNNPSLMKHMYFGPGIDSEIKSEYWHGTLWGESPFFGQEKITISSG
jgi:hypothetical protein